MKKTETAVQMLLADIEGKDILEAACGCAEFSCAAAPYAHSVMCIDLVESRIKGPLPENVHFEMMDAAAMRWPDETFDAVFLYNAFYHIQPQWGAIEKECRRVLKPGGKIYLLSLWGLDKAPLIKQYGTAAQQQGDFLIVPIIK